MVATLDQISRGRVDINIVPGGIQGDFERLGVEIDHAGRYEQAEELMRACRFELDVTEAAWRLAGPFSTLTRTAWSIATSSLTIS